MIAAPHKRDVIGQRGMFRKNFADPDVGRFGLDRLEGTANFERCFGLGVEGVELTRRTEVENHDAGPVVLARFLARLRSLGLHRREVRQSQAHRPERPNLHEVTPSDAITCVSRSSSCQIEHESSLHVRPRNWIAIARRTTVVQMPASAILAVECSDGF